MRVILASSSPRRKELMKMLDIPFEVMVKGVNEEFTGNYSIYEQSMEISKRKAMAIYENIEDDVIVIGSDTVVIYNNKIYGKPKNRDEAFSMLKEFSDNTHEVLSSLCLLVRKDGKECEELTYDKCDVTIDEMTDLEINEWIDNNDVYTKAGAYAIQEGFGKFIKNVNGDYFSIVGFPVHKLYNLIKKYI